MADIYFEDEPLRLGSSRKRRSGLILSIIVALAVIVGAGFLASTLLDYQWWGEMHQLDTWYSLLLYTTLPVTVATVIYWALFYSAFRAGRRQNQSGKSNIISVSLLNRIVAIVVLFVAWIAARAVIDNWTVVRFFAGRQIAPPTHEYVDPIFGQPLHFYFFTLPFWNLLLAAVLTAIVGSMVIYWIAAFSGSIARKHGPGVFEFEASLPKFEFRHLDSSYLRYLGAVLLLGVAAKIYLNRYDLLFTDHGTFLVGVDWLADHLVIPLQWALILSAIAAAALILARRARWSLAFLLVVVARFVLPAIVSAVYVHPNELALEKPYIQHHIEATRSAFGLNARVTERQLAAKPEVQLDFNKHRATLTNVRLWDWRAFHDTLSQIQPLRPYVYRDTDIDRYTIDGDLRQVLVSARVLDLSQLGEARNRWINPHLMYTHSYGLVMAESNRITTDGLPMLFIQNAPAEVTTSSLKLTQPDIYFGESTHEPVFVNTGQQEFDYPSGTTSVYTRYAGAGGFPVGGLLTRLAATLHYADPNILLTGYINSESRMMMHREILDRVQTLAGFLEWDGDPYIVVRADGRLVWLIDGYMTSDAHPYSRSVGENIGRYIRNSVKATVDAYSGEVHFYVFDPNDTLIQAYSKLFPKLFEAMSAMPADVRAHARYPETLFSAQAEIYRAFHMRDPEAFYNRADFWDIARTPVSSDENGSGPESPTYVVASLPGADKSEFLLMTQFTPNGKDNLIGQMIARCDGDHLGEIVFEQLSKQNIVYGPMQIDARINQDQNISKDLTLWNQQGSKVVRGQTLVLPIEDSFLYVEPIYIQASQASMPQLKKVALAMGNKLAYADTYEQALNQLIGEVGGAAQETEQQPQQAATVQQTAQPQPTEKSVDELRQIRDHLARYRELSAQGKWAEAGKELDAIQALVNK